MMPDVALGCWVNQIPKQVSVRGMGELRRRRPDGEYIVIYLVAQRKLFYLITPLNNV